MMRPTKWDCWLYPTDGDPLKLGQVRAHTLDEAFDAAKVLTPVLPAGYALCLVKPGEDVSQAARQRTLLQSRLWRSAEVRRVGAHLARKRQRRPMPLTIGAW